MEDFWNAENWFGQNLLGTESTLPAVNIRENDQNFEIEVAAPGFQKEDFKLDVEKNVLTISAETKKENTEENDNYTRREFSYSSFSRSFTLPETVQEDQIKAKYENGLLNLTLQKSAKASAQRKSIPVE